MLIGTTWGVTNLPISDDKRLKSSSHFLFKQTQTLCVDVLEQKAAGTFWVFLAEQSRVCHTPGTSSLPGFVTAIPATFKTAPTNTLGGIFQLSVRRVHCEQV